MKVKHWFYWLWKYQILARTSRCREGMSWACYRGMASCRLGWHPIGESLISFNQELAAYTWEPSLDLDSDQGGPHNSTLGD